MRVRRWLPVILYIQTLAIGACAEARGSLKSDPWPRIPDQWTDVPKPLQLDRGGAVMTAKIGEFYYQACTVLPGVASVRVMRKTSEPLPSHSLADGVRPSLAGNASAVEAAALEVVSRMQVSADPDCPGAWRWIRTMEPGEFIVGLGERPGSMHQRGRRAVMWNSDNYGYEHDELRLYQSIPFWMSIKNGRARGFFIDNTHRIGFDVGARHENLLEALGAGGDIQIYLIDGPTPREVVERFAALTGRAAMPPKWALGYQQCRWSYESRDRVLGVARAFREAKIPCDAIFCDIDHMDGYRSFTVNEARFPDFAGMVGELRKLGLRAVTIVDPGLKIDAKWSVYREGSARELYVADAQGQEYAGSVWPGPAAFPDFTREDVREWWGSLHKPMLDAGVAGFWNDMNEPAIFDGPDKTMPEDCKHQGYGGGTHARFHNIYGMLMAKATYDAMSQLRPGLRPYVVTRSNFAGGQKYASTWTGDNRALWPELQRSIAMTLNLGICGQPFAGPDIGGFDTNMENGGSPFPDVTPELHARWLELGALLPIARSHTIRGSMDREPYAYGEPWTSLNRAAIERRYRLLPYLYTLAEEAHSKGVPIARPMFWNSCDDAIAIKTEDQFLLGDSLLVAPVVEASADSRSVYLPAGLWYPFDPNDVKHASPIEGPKRIQVDAPIGKLPLFARAGAIIPTEPVRQSVSETPADTLVVDAFCGVGTFTLFEDAGEGFGYKVGECARTYFEVTQRGGRATLSCAAREGNWNLRRRVVARLHTPDGIAEATFDDDGRAREILSAAVERKSPSGAPE